MSEAQEIGIEEIGTTIKSLIAEIIEIPEEEIEDDEFGSDFGDSESNDGRLGNDSSGD